MELRLQFSDASLQVFDWLKWDQHTSKVVERGKAEVEDLVTIARDCARCLCFLPQQDILLTAAQYPGKANKQQLNAIAYEIEDQLAEDIDD